MTMAPTCRRCGAILKFVKMSTTGGTVPVDPIPNPGGTVAARKIGDRMVGYTLRSGETEARAGFTLYRNHLIDCPPNQVKHTRGEAEQLF